MLTDCSRYADKLAKTYRTINQKVSFHKIMHSFLCDSEWVYECLYNTNHILSRVTGKEKLSTSYRLWDEKKIFSVPDEEKRKYSVIPWGNILQCNCDEKDKSGSTLTLAIDNKQPAVQMKTQDLHTSHSPILKHSYTQKKNRTGGKYTCWYFCCCCLSLRQATVWHGPLLFFRLVLRMVKALICYVEILYLHQR